MHAVLRPYVTAGVSLIGASAIAISPISPVPAALSGIHDPAHAVSSAMVNLVASPTDFYTGLFVRTTTNLGQLAGNFLGDPAPILAQVIANQVANADALVVALAEGVGSLAYAVSDLIPQQLHTASVALANGDVETALNALLAIPGTLAIPLIDSLYDAFVAPIMLAVNRINNIVQNATGTIVLASAIAIMGPVISTIGSVGSAVQGVINAAGTGDIGKVVQAVVNVPGIIADGFLNGGYGPLLLGYIPAPGILDSITGPIAAVLGIRQLIAQELAPPPLPPLPFAAEATQRSGAEEQRSAALFDAKSASLETDPAGDVQVDPAAQETGTEGGGDPTGTPGGGTDLSEGEGADGGDPAGTPGADTTPPNDTDTDTDGAAGGESPESAGKPGGGTDLSKGNKAEPGKTGTTSTRQDKEAPEAATGSNVTSEPTVKGADADESSNVDKGAAAAGAAKTGADGDAGDKGNDKGGES